MTWNMQATWKINRKREQKDVAMKELIVNPQDCEAAMKE